MIWWSRIVLTKRCRKVITGWPFLRLHHAPLTLDTRSYAAVALICEIAINRDGRQTKRKEAGGDSGLYCRLGGGMVLRRLKQSLQK